MFFGNLTIAINGFLMVFLFFYHRFQWFSMVPDHWSNDEMVSMDRCGLKWMKVNESGWKQMKVDESGWMWMKVDESGWRWMKVDENRWNGRNWLHFFFFIFFYFSAYIKHTGGFNHKSIQTSLGSSPQIKMTTRNITHNHHILWYGDITISYHQIWWNKMDAEHNCNSIFQDHNHACQKIVDW